MSNNCQCGPWSSLAPLGTSPPLSKKRIRILGGHLLHCEKPCLQIEKRFLGVGEIEYRVSAAYLACGQSTRSLDPQCPLNSARVIPSSTELGIVIVSSILQIVIV